MIYYETDLKQSKVFGGSATKFSPNGDVEYWVYHINSHPRLMFHAVSPTSWIPAPVPQDEAIKSPAVSDCFWYFQLVGGFKHFLFSIIYGIILPIDFHIFQYG